MAGSDNGSTPTPQNSVPTPQPQQISSNITSGGVPPGGPPPPGYNPYGFFPNPMPGMMTTHHAGYPSGFGSPFPLARGAAEASEKSETPEVHVITLHPRGMPRPFDVPFPERRLPVCDRCKKNYKSRDLCRTRDGHKTLPWTTTYVAITIDDSLMVQEDGKPSIADVPTIGLLMDIPLMCLGPSDGSMKSEPICKVCREKNYTRDYCRNTCKHTTPPWSTTYVKIVADTRAEGERLGYGASRRSAKRRKKNTGEDGEDGKIKSEISVSEIQDLSAYQESYEGEERDILNSDDLTLVHQSMTFLAKVSSKSVTVKWCERIKYPESAEKTTLETAFKKDSETEELSSTSAAGSSAQNPNSMPGPTNERLWEAFQAGVMWATSQQRQIPAGGMPPGYGYGVPMQGTVGYFGQPPTPGPGGEMHGVPIGYGGLMGYGGQMNDPQGHVSALGGAGGPQDWDKKTFMNKNPSDGEEATEGENNDARVL